MSADNSSLLPPPNGSSMAMQVNARTHSEPFMATKSFHIPPPQTFYMLMKSFEVVEESNHLHSRQLQIAYTAATVYPTEGITYSEARSQILAIAPLQSMYGRE